MISVKGQFVLLASIVLLSMSGFASALNVAETCQIVPNNTYIADPTNCAGWALCISGAPLYGQCNNGLVYNSQKAMCDWPDDVTCIANVTTLCTGLNNVYKANPSDCQSYCYCQNGIAGCVSCPTGQVYNPNMNSCVWSSTYTCTVSSACALVPDNVFVQDTANCSQYYLCQNGVGLAGACPSGYLYNGVKGSCDFTANVICPNATSPPDTDTNEPGIATSCATLAAGQTSYSDGTTCQGYYSCSNGVATFADCPNGSHYSQALQQCVSPYSVACPYNRCEGLTYTFVTAINTNCKEYFVCSNGATKANSEAGCPASFPYFDEVRQACVPTEPSYAVC